MTTLTAPPKLRNLRWALLAAPEPPASAVWAIERELDAAPEAVAAGHVPPAALKAPEQETQHTPGPWRRVERALIGLSWVGAAYLAVRIAQGLIGQ